MWIVPQLPPIEIAAISLNLLSFALWSSSARCFSINPDRVVVASSSASKNVQWSSISELDIYISWLRDVFAK